MIIVNKFDVDLTINLNYEQNLEILQTMHLTGTV